MCWPKNEKRKMTTIKKKWSQGMIWSEMWFLVEVFPSKIEKKNCQKPLCRTSLQRSGATADFRQKISLSGRRQSLHLWGLVRGSKTHAHTLLGGRQPRGGWVLWLVV